MNFSRFGNKVGNRHANDTRLRLRGENVEGREDKGEDVAVLRVYRCRERIRFRTSCGLS
jgi:hypothetical protein